MDTTIDDIKAKIDLVQFVGATVSLRKQGNSYMGFCPFHANTKTPSFVVFPATQTWKCFGACAESGDIFSYVQKRDGLTFPEAMVVLAQHAGVTLPDKREMSIKADHGLYECMADAANYYHEQLLKGADTKPRQYVSGRGLTQETVATFQLGYAPAHGGLKEHLLKVGYSEAKLIEVGLLSVSESDKPHDRFRHRLMIPIRNHKGEVVGFGGRAMQENQTPKYLNSPQSIIFDKGNLLFGLDLARRDIAKLSEVVIVEGYMDVIQARQHGVKNIVAQMGTALTPNQLRLVTKSGVRVVLALDADEAGKLATIRNLSKARQWLPKSKQVATVSHGLSLTTHTNQELAVLTLPSGQDPDDVLKSGGLAAWQAMVQQAQSVVDYYEELVLAQVNVNTPQGKAQVVHELMPVYREITDTIEQSARVNRLAQKLGLKESLLMAELQRHTPNLESTITQLSTPPAQLSDAGIVILALLYHYPSALTMANELLQSYSLAAIDALDFTDSTRRELYHGLSKYCLATKANPLDIVRQLGHWSESWVMRLHGYTLPTLESKSAARQIALLISQERLKRLNEEVALISSQCLAAESTNKAELYQQMAARVQQRAKLEKVKGLKK